MGITLVLVQLLVGIVLLAWSADRFLHASIALARRWNWSPIVIGIVLVGFGTSFPELVVSLSASVRGSGAVAVGNVFGSNIANFLLVFGVSACLFPIAVKRSVWARDYPLLLGLTVLLALILYSNLLSWPQGLMLTVLLVVIVVVTLKRGKKEQVAIDESVVHSAMLLWKAVLWWVISLVLIAVASECLIDSAVSIARLFGVSELVIGLTVVTLGTSLPELAATLVSAWRGQSDIALGHLVGSNLFNATLVLAMPAFFASGQLPVGIWHRDYPWMLAVTVLLWPLLIWQSKKTHFNRWLGGALILAYAIYLFTLLGA